MAVSTNDRIVNVARIGLDRHARRLVNSFGDVLGLEELRDVLRAYAAVGDSTLYVEFGSRGRSDTSSEWNSSVSDGVERCFRFEYTRSEIK